MEDISERKKFLEETEAQNQRFREIAWIQSHLVRAPLARIKELNQVLREGDWASSEEELIYRQALHRSVDELDSIVHEISEKSQVIERKEEQRQNGFEANKGE